MKRRFRNVNFKKNVVLVEMDKMYLIKQKRDRISRWLLSILCSLLLFSSSFAENNVAVVVDGVYTNVGGRIRIGNTGTNNQLRIINGGWLDSTSGFVGNKASASNNFALVEGANSVWNNSGTLYVGKDGSFNTLRIRQGGTVYSATGLLGNVTNSTGNVVLLQNANSAWVIENNLQIGNKGGTNRLEISNGALVSNARGTIGQASTSTGNEILISGTGSRWENRSQLYVGFYGSENSLVVSNAALVSAESVYVGNKNGANENKVLLDGTQTRLFVTNDFRFGAMGSTNQMLIANGARVENGKGFIGYGNKAHANQIVVSGPGSIWTNRLNLTVGNKQDYNELVITNGGVTFASNVIVGYAKSAKNNRIVVTGSNSFLNVKGDLRVGRDGDRNRLFVLDRADVLATGNLYVGNSEFAWNNELFVRGTNSFLQVNKSIFVGNYGSKNRLYIQEGGAVDLTTMRIGVREGADNNQVFVQDAGSKLSIHNVLSVGYRGVKNQMLIDSGARVSADSVSVGAITSAVNNQFSLDGAGTTLVVTNSVIVGNHGPTNQMVVKNGAVVQSKDLFIGRYADSSSNSVLLSNATWQANDISIGRLGDSNTVSLSAGAIVESENTYLGYRSIGNALDLDGAGTSWSNAFDFVIGANDVATNNFMTIRNGAKLKTRSLAVRSGNGLKLNHSAQVLITGGTTRSLKGGGQIVIGDTQGNNLISLTQGGKIVSGEVILGAQSGAQDNVVTISGLGSRWESKAFVVGSLGGTNRLSVSDNGTLKADSLVLGQYASSANNQVVVTGAGSSIQISNNLTVGSNSGEKNFVHLLNEGSISAKTTTIHDQSILHLENGKITSDYILVDLGGTLAGWGTVAGVTTNAGLIDVGDTTHFLTLNFSDSLVLADSSEIILDVLDKDNHDKISAKDIVFGGTLTVRFANNYTPQVGDSFDLFDWNSTMLRSSSQNISVLTTSGVSLDTSKLETTGEIEVIPEPVVSTLIIAIAFLFIVGRRLGKRFLG